MSIQTESAIHFTLIELSEIQSSSFAEYFVPVDLTPIKLAEKIRIDSLDLESSHVALLDGRPIGIALMARRGASSRLAAMAIAPPHRGKGFGRQLLRELIAEECKRQTQSIALEVIEENNSARQLYEQAGFRYLRRLVGFVCERPEGSSEKAEPVDLRKVGQAMIQWAPPDLPWQVSGESVIQLGSPSLGFRLDGAFAAVTPRDNTEMWLRCIVVVPHKRRQGQATRLLRALLSQFPAVTWNVGALFPEENSSLFTRIGFRESALSQVQMCRHQ